MSNFLMLILIGSYLYLIDIGLFYMSTGGEDDIDEGHTQASSPVSEDSKCQIFTVWFLILDKAHQWVSLSSLLHIFPLKQYKGLISMKSKKTQIILQKMLVD
jgi:hypothetical protein